MSSENKAAYHAGEVKGQAQEKTNAFLGKASDAAAGAKDKAIDGKDKAGGFLQQAGENVKNAAIGTTEAVKNTLGIGEKK